MKASRGRGPQTGFRVIAVLLSLALVQGIFIAWMLLRRPAALTPETGTPGGVMFADENLLRNAYPNVDFTPLYPGWSREDIDLVQREIYGLRYFYEPFIQFRPLPVQKRFVTVTEPGYRAGAEPQPWPPRREDYVVFVFGGSTTFSYGVPDDRTVVVGIQKAIQARHPQLRVQAYNFSAGYYFSSQERALFESLLLRGIVPDVAIFIDGVNDFFFYDGRPALTATLHKALSPDVPLAPKPSAHTRDEVVKLVEGVLSRYLRNVRLIEAAARAHGVRVLFVGQPAPFVDKPRPETYPFPPPTTDHRLAASGYVLFKQTGSSGAFGPQFVWCGDVFANATSPMYADALHYSVEGCRLFADTLVERAVSRGLLP